MVNIDNIIFEEPRKTFMEILKVNQREVPFANLLGFFFRPRERHGLNKLFLEALLNTWCSDIGHADNGDGESIVRNRGYKNNLTSRLANGSIESSSILVKVEQPTGLEKRIDILIESDDFVVCIEFKINHDLDNPLEEYKRYVIENYPGKLHFYIVLTPFKKEAIGEARRYFGQHTEFKQVILSHFFLQVKEELHRFHTNENEVNEYYRYFTDFVQTVENRKIKTLRSQAFKTLQGELNKSGLNCEYHTKNGGFLEIKVKNEASKIRLKPDGWQLEKWVNKKLTDYTLLLDKSTGFEQLLGEIKAFHKLIKTTVSLVD
ncbi:PD-(D/E)XK nuclease family protein [Rufibacter tibetensis]|uniref:PD-(D/E)XK nuclease superfamily protein n=1 Tax=Rufibacter tibetensis TaxID=512763 RepID=A0A0P0D1M4_9BACT|nr:PD-(D/E)XK nuclease family protein [Rufibacter tibetensis]ALJ00755.1 hypothetical protein DC20_19420 [Rufibacter tibetensis]